MTQAFRINPISPLHYQVVTTGDPVLDYETMPHAFDLQILVADSAGAMELQVLTVQVTNVNEPPVFQGNLANQTVVIYILERTPPGVIYQVYAGDPETTSPRRVEFSLSPDSTFFSISPTGTISTLKEFDFEKDLSSYTLNVTITDDLRVSIRRILIVNIINENDEFPYFTTKEKVFKIREEAAPGTFVANITAKDPDGEHFILSLRYSMGVPEGIPKFYINPKLIYIYINIQPENEFDPVFNSSLYIFNVSEMMSPNSPIGAILATDEDLPPTGISYSILSGESGGGVTDLFVIDPQLGILKNTKRLDYEAERVHTLKVEASDNDGGIGTSSVSNVNNHFDFSPKAGSNISRLVLINPFDYKSGMDTVWEYRLLVSITDDNLLTSSERTSVHVQNGTVKLTVRVIPDPTTVIPTTPGVTIVTSKENVYAVLAWYVPFFILLGSLLLLGLLGYLTVLLAKYLRSCCPPRPKPDTKPLLHMPEKKKAKEEVIWEMTNLNPVFDGEAIDPVTGKVYEYNSKSGARRWKDTNVLSKAEGKDSVVQVTTPPKSGEGNLSKAEATTTVGDLKQKPRSPKSGEKDLPKAEAESGGSQGDLKQKTPPRNGQTANGNLKLQKGKEEPLSNQSPSPTPPRRSPIPSPKIYPKYQNQS
ncbi:cadherin-related family member 3 [Crotalus adamanteus]|uniref:Cadherin-related family member 3 n=1 Tax=Crotalus adamanteus TaxID=8729 RepID=A0AAW1BB57_CROAD